MAASSSATNLGFFRTTRIFRELMPAADETCCICLEEYGTGHRAVRVHFRGCLHTFGRACLDRWLESGSPMSHCCPICRAQWYTPNAAETNDTRASYANRFSAVLNLVRNLIRHDPPDMLGARRNSNVITGMPPTMTVEAHLHAISWDLSRLEELNLESESRSADIQELLLYLDIRMELLRQSIRDLQASSRSSTSRTGIPGRSLRRFESHIDLSTPRNRIPISRNRDRDFVGFLDHVQSSHYDHQRSPFTSRHQLRNTLTTSTALPPYEATLEHSRTTSIVESSFNVTPSLPSYDEAVGQHWSTGIADPVETHLTSSSTPNISDEAVNVADAPPISPSDSRTSWLQFRPILEGINSVTPAPPIELPQTPIVLNSSFQRHHPHSSGELRSRHDVGRTSTGSID